MGTLRFRVFPPERITEEMVQQAYLSGIDRATWPVRVRVEGDELLLQRAVSDSANLHVPWRVEGHGPLTLSTASLIERAEPYLLPLELARGTLVQVRNQLSEWQVLGLAVPEAAHAGLAAAVERFSRAAVEQADAAASARDAEEALRGALDAADLLAAAYTDQSMAGKRGRESFSARESCLADHKAGETVQDVRPPFLSLGVDLGTTLLDDAAARHVLAVCNAAEVPPGWRGTESTEGTLRWTTTDAQVEWCRAHGLRVLLGPIVQLDPHALPDWLLLFDDDAESVIDCATGFVRETVRRYRGKVDAWVCAGRVNAAEALAMTENDRLRLVANAVETVRSLDPRTPALVSFAQPWAEYLRERRSDFPPLHFADTLVRAGADLGGLMLELNVGFHPGGTLPRHPIEFSRQLDAWSKLGLPLWLSVSAPSATGDDPLARRKASLPQGGWSPETQRRWAARFIPLALAKPAVRGVVWNQLRDGVPHDFPHGGLFDAHGRAKPTLRTLAAIRQTFSK